MTNRYPDRFLELLAGLPDDALVLDDGAGGRAHDRIIGLEYVPHPANTVQGDGQALPFADDVFDLVLSQATLEHVPDPQAYMDEILRVLRPGGEVWVEAAFMQPLHQEPHHYFNFTPYGLAHVCRGFEVVDSGVFGLLAETWEWIARDIDADGKIGFWAIDGITRDLQGLDGAMRPEDLQRVAPAVFIHGRKRVTEVVDSER